MQLGKNDGVDWASVVEGFKYMALLYIPNWNSSSRGICEYFLSRMACHQDVHSLLFQG